MFRDKLELLGVDACMSPHCELDFPVSTFLSGYKAPTLGGKTLGNSLLLPKSIARWSKRVVVKGKFHGTKDGRYYSVMIENGDVQECEN